MAPVVLLVCLCFYAVHNAPNADPEYDGVVLEILVVWSLWLVPDAESECDGVVLGSNEGGFWILDYEITSERLEILQFASEEHTPGAFASCAPFVRPSVQCQYR